MEDWSQYSEKLKNKSTYIPNTIYNENIPKILNQNKIYYRKKLGFKEERFIISIIGKFMNRKKDPRSEFWIAYDKTIAGPYISYRGLKGV